MLRLNVVLSERFSRKIFQIEGDDNAGLRTNCRGEDVAIVCVRELQLLDQAFVPCDQTVGYGSIHKIACAMELLFREVRSIPEGRPNPFLVNLRGPLRAKQSGQRESYQQISQRGRIQHACVVNRNEVSQASITHVEFLSLAGEFVRQLFALLHGVFAIRKEIFEKNSSMRADLPIRNLVLLKQAHDERP